MFRQGANASQWSGFWTDRGNVRADLLALRSGPADRDRYRANQREPEDVWFTQFAHATRIRIDSDYGFVIRLSACVVVHITESIDVAQAAVDSRLIDWPRKASS